MMSDFYHFFLAPFAEYAFMRRALVACLLLALSGAPLGLLLVLRRMSLTGEAISHAVLPGIAAGFLCAGLSVPAMSFGGLAAGLAVALLAGLVSRLTALREDANLAAFYLVALALGVLLMSMRGNAVDLVHLLFGSVLAVDDASLFLVAGVSGLTVILMAVLARPLVVEAFDPSFLRAMGGRGSLVHLAFLIMVVLNLVAGFQAMGTLMAVGLMILPATAARFWADAIGALAVAAVVIGLLASWGGLLLSYHLNAPSGPAIVLSAGAIYLVSLLLGRTGSIRARYFPGRHLET